MQEYSFALFYYNYYNNHMKNTFIYRALPTMTITDEKIANYIDSNYKNLSNMTSSQLASIVGVSQSSVIKFSQKLGYPSYKRMISDVTSDQQEDTLNEELDINESTATTIAKLQQAYNNVFKLIPQLNPTINIEKAAKLINDCTCIKLFAYNARENYLAHYLANELLRIGIQAIISSNLTEMTAQAAISKSNEVFLILSKSGETREMLNFAKIARKNNAKVISITRTQKNSLAKLSDVNLKTVEYRNRTYMRERLVTASFMFLIDLVTLSVIKLRPEIADRNISKTWLYTKPSYVEPDE